MRIGGREFYPKDHTYLMAILNVTPDSFSDGGRYRSRDAALFHAREMIAEGADILDIGGESTRPGHQPVGEQEEMERILPVVEALRGEFDIPLSVDTYRSGTAREALRAGADLINDIWGFRYDPEMAQVVKEYGAACCLMHNRREAVYEDLLADMCRDLQESVERAKAAGIADERIILDPGIGFAKTLEMNLEVMRHLDRFCSLGYPLLLGASRKSMIGLSLDLPVEEREEGTLVTTVMAVQSGYGFVRVHDVKKNIRAIRMTEAILGRKSPDPEVQEERRTDGI